MEGLLMEIKTVLEALSYIHTRTRFGSQKSLVRMRSLMERLGNPQDALSFVHVAGTNGKGSVSTMSASVLQCAGYRTGLYTSPYLVRFHERFRVDGVCISDEMLVALTQQVADVAEQLTAETGLEPTEFEIVTAIGFLFFKAMACDVVVLEVGLGGRLDSTNVIKSPVCAMITPVSADHTAILGDTIAEIAAEKAGIIKPHTQVICGRQEAAALEVIRRVCSETESTLTVVPQELCTDVEVSLSGTRFRFAGHPYHLRLIGTHQAQNASMVLCLIERMREKGFHIPQKAVEDGLSKAFIAGRFDVRASSPIVVVDGAHNPDAARVLARSLSMLPVSRYVVVMAVMQDKDYHTVIHTIAGVCDAVVACEVRDMPRTLSAKELAQTAKEVCPRCETASDGLAALIRGREIAGKNGAVIVCGSLYLAGEIVGALETKNE